MKVRGIPRLLVGAALTGLVILVPLLGPAAGSAGAASTSWFVIGDGSATPQSTVEFWGAQWSQDNLLSGGPAPSSFKGFADNVPAMGDCSGTFTFTTRPGDSSAPPPSLPLMDGIVHVLIATSITKSGSTISGTFVDIGAVLPDPGYAADPGHAGTGTFLGSLCANGGGGSSPT